MAIAFQSPPGAQPQESEGVLAQYFAFMEWIGVPQEAFLTFVLVTLFLLAVFFFRADSFGSGRR